MKRYLAVRGIDDDGLIVDTNDPEGGSAGSVVARCEEVRTAVRLVKELNGE